METAWSDAAWDAPLDPLDAQEIEGAINEASHMPIPGIDGGEPEAGMPSGWNGDASWSGPVPAGPLAPSIPGHNLSEEDAAALLVDIMSKSAVYVEEGKLQVEPDADEVEHWDEQKNQDAHDIIGQVTGQPENAQLIADALELENARLETLMAEYEEAAAQAGNDEEAAEVVALAHEIQELHAKIQDLTEQYMRLEGLPVPGARGPHPAM